jgi:hypothetical protein
MFSGEKVLLGPISAREVGAEIMRFFRVRFPSLKGESRRSYLDIVMPLSVYFWFYCTRAKRERKIEILYGS